MIYDVTLDREEAIGQRERILRFRNEEPSESWQEIVLVKDGARLVKMIFRFDDLANANFFRLKFGGSLQESVNEANEAVPLSEVRYSIK